MLTLLPMTSGTRVRRDVAFSSAGEECRGGLFMPDAERPPLVILGATREFGLEPYARRFADAGIAHRCRGARRLRRAREGVSARLRPGLLGARRARRRARRRRDLPRRGPPSR